MKNIILIIILFFIVGCGYSVRTGSDLPFNEIQITSLRNKTYEPNIEDILHRKLADEFIKQGISVNNFSEYTISGEIREFTLKAVSEKDEFSREYEVIIRALFTVTGPDNLKKEFRAIQSPFIESFIAEREINSIIAFKEIATARALEFLSRRLVFEVIYR